MMLNWLLITGLSTSFIIALILVLRPLVRRVFGAQTSYWLWALVPLHIVLPEIPFQPQFAGELFALPSDFQINTSQMVPAPDSTLPWLVLWLIGTGLYCAIQSYRYHNFRRQALALSVHMDAGTLDPVVQSELQTFSGELYSTPLPSAPFAMGLARSRIFLPADFATHYTTSQQMWIIRHERAHLDRGDVWIQLSAELIRAIWWFNPLVHIANAALRNDQEYACDQFLVGRATRQDRIAYGETLLHGSLRAHGLLNTNFFKLHKERFKMIAKHQISKTRTTTSFIFITLLGLTLLTTTPQLTAGVLDNKPLTLNFQQIEANKLVKLIGDYVGVEVEGMVQLQNLRVDVKVNEVSARQALAIILHCHGYDFTEKSGGIIHIVRLDDPQPERCR